LTEDFFKGLLFCYSGESLPHSLLINSKGAARPPDDRESTRAVRRRIEKRQRYCKTGWSNYRYGLNPEGFICFRCFFSEWHTKPAKTLISKTTANTTKRYVSFNRKLFRK